MSRTRQSSLQLVRSPFLFAFLFMHFIVRPPSLHPTKTRGYFYFSIQFFLKARWWLCYHAYQSSVCFHIYAPWYLVWHSQFDLTVMLLQQIETRTIINFRNAVDLHGFGYLYMFLSSNFVLWNDFFVVFSLFLSVSKVPALVIQCRIFVFINLVIFGIVQTKESTERKTTKRERDYTFLSFVVEVKHLHDCTPNTISIWLIYQFSQMTVNIPTIFYLSIVSETKSLPRMTLTAVVPAAAAATVAGQSISVTYNCNIFIIIITVHLNVIVFSPSYSLCFSHAC